MTSRLLIAFLCVLVSLGVVSCQSTGGGQAGQTAESVPQGPTVAELRAKLKDPDASVRLTAVEELGPRAKESQEAVDALVEALADSDRMVRRFAAHGLAEVEAPSPAMLQALAKLLKDPWVDPRAAAAQSLTMLARRVPADSVKDLATALAASVGDRDESTRILVVAALGALGAPAAVQVPAVRPALEKGLRDPSAQVRATAAGAIGQLGPGIPWTVALLIKALDDPVHDVRKEAVVALEKFGPQAAPAAKALARQLRGKEIYLRVFAADALAAIGPGAKAALPELKALVKRGWKDLEGSPEMEAEQLPDSVAKAIASIEAKPPKPAPAQPVAVPGKTAVKGHFAETNIGEFDLVDGIAWPDGGNTVVYAVSKPIASAVLAGSPCPMTMARSLTALRNAGWVEVTLNAAGKSAYFGSGTPFGGTSRESEVGGNYWSSRLRKAGGRVAGSVEHKERGRFEFDLPLSSPKVREVAESDRTQGIQAHATRPSPTEQAMAAAYRAIREAALKKDIGGILAAQGFDPKAIAALRNLPGIQADLDVFANRFLKPGTVGETEVREGHGYVGSEGVNSKGEKFLNFYFFTPCQGKLALYSIGENPL
jgi:HEAT repeat protein